MRSKITYVDQKNYKNKIVVQAYGRSETAQAHLLAAMRRMRRRMRMKMLVFNKY
ncbi:hypothetical protein FHW17_002265 [Phyllobacterium sp. P30BS-XVII]|nr:hypothetical protein [Phyllobacterium sp. P30BS-XVII]SDP06212.1 hypothetical protein SAMN05443582_103296 [Phyllobacterium sp. OV277]